MDTLEKILHAMDADYNQSAEEQTKQISQLKYNIAMKYKKYKEK